MEAVQVIFLSTEAMKYDRAVQPDNPPGMGTHFYGVVSDPGIDVPYQKKMLEVMCIGKKSRSGISWFSTRMKIIDMVSGMRTGIDINSLYTPAI